MRQLPLLIRSAGAAETVDPPRSCISCGQAFTPRPRHFPRARCIAAAVIVVTGCAYVANSPFLRRRCRSGARQNATRHLADEFTSFVNAPHSVLPRCRTVLRHARKGIFDSERRVTNGLIAVHAALFAAQFASNGAVTQWGAKVYFL